MGSLVFIAACSVRFSLAFFNFIVSIVVLPFLSFNPSD